MLFRDLLTAIKEGRRPSVDGHQGRRSVEAILAIGFYMTMARLTESTETELDAAEGRRIFEAARSAADG